MSRHTARTLTLESLEDRLTLSATPAANPLEAMVAAKASPVLSTIYNQFTAYDQAGSPGQFTSTDSGQVEMSGSAVGVDIRLLGNFQGNLANMEAIGMDVTATDPNIGLVEGFLPIGQLPPVAVDPNLVAVTPVLVPGQNLATSPTAQSDEAAVALKGGSALGTLYQEFLNYEAAGGTGTFAPAEASQILVAGGAVGVDLTTPLANLPTMIAEINALGMDVTATATTGQVGIIEGFVLIADLPMVATNPGLIGMGPIYKPVNF
jgi:hypothetical protein